VQWQTRALTSAKSAMFHLLLFQIKAWWDLPSSLEYWEYFDGGRRGAFPSAISALVDEGELCPLQNPLCFIYFGSFFFEGRSQGISPLPWNIMNIMIERGNSTTTETYSLPCSPQEGLSSVDALIG